MQTAFSPQQLRDPAMLSSEGILRTCVHCGFCTATCPTYLLLGDELDSPRGRIYLIKDMLEGEKPATAEIVKHIDRCLSCLSCMTTCPSGVHYMHLVDHARAYIEKTYQRPWHDRVLRSVLSKILPYPDRFRLALRVAIALKPFKNLIGILPVLGLRLSSMLDLAPKSLPSRDRAKRSVVFPAEGERRGRVAILDGCAQPILKPSINEAAIRLLNRHGVDVVMTEKEGCCGALVHHMGRETESHAFAKRNIDVWIEEIEKGGLDAIVVTTSGCGTTIKDYGFIFRNDPDYAQKAALVSKLTKDITEYVTTLPLSHAAMETNLTVAYHPACSLQHGQQIRDEPKHLLKQMGFMVKNIPESHICCGSAGTYNLLQPELARKLQARKVDNIEKTAPDLIATGNVGCIMQIAKKTKIPVVHTVELLDWATGGPRPFVS